MSQEQINVDLFDEVKRLKMENELLKAENELLQAKWEAQGLMIQNFTKKTRHIKQHWKKSNNGIRCFIL